MNQQDIEQVVKAVLLKMKDSSQPATTVHEMGVFASLDDAVAAAKAYLDRTLAESFAWGDIAMLNQGTTLAR